MEEHQTTSFDSYLAFDSYLSGEKHPYNFLLENDDGDYSSFAMPGDEAEFLREAYDGHGATLDRDFYPVVHRLGDYADEIRFELDEPIGEGVQQMPEGRVLYRNGDTEVVWNARMDRGFVAALLTGGVFETINENVSELETIQEDFEEVARYPPEARRTVEFDSSLFEAEEPGVDPSEYETMRFDSMDEEMAESIESTEFREGIHPSAPMIVNLEGYDREFVPGVLGSESAEKFFRRQTGYGMDTLLENGVESNRTHDLSSWISEILEKEDMEATLYAQISEISEGDISNPADPGRSQEVKGFATTAYLYLEDEEEFVEIPNGVFIDRFTEDLEFQGKIRDSPELPEFESEEDEDLRGFQ
ncbi:MAG: hypothetical protein ABEJ98_05500 [Candidatus Nanohaloarchaea archaeon]